MPSLNRIGKQDGAAYLKLKEKGVWEIGGFFFVGGLADKRIEVSEEALPTHALDAEDDIHDEDDEGEDESCDSDDYCATLELFEGRPRDFVHEFVVAFFYIGTEFRHLNYTRY